MQGGDLASAHIIAGGPGDLCRRWLGFFVFRNDHFQKLQGMSSLMLFSILFLAFVCNVFRCFLFAKKASKFNPPIEFALREGKVATPKVQHLNYQSCKSSFLYIFVSESGKTPLCITYFDVSYVLDVLSSSSRPHSKQDRKKVRKITRTKLSI